MRMTLIDFVDTFLAILNMLSRVNLELPNCRALLDSAQLEPLLQSL
jgi:hypothetical protein